MIYVYRSPPQALIPLASDNTDIGKIKAAQALAKITITSNPEIAFPGERVRVAFCKKLQFFSVLENNSTIHNIDIKNRRNKQGEPTKIFSCLTLSLTPFVVRSMRPCAPSSVF